MGDHRDLVRREAGRELEAKEKEVGLLANELHNTSMELSKARNQLRNYKIALKEKQEAEDETSRVELPAWVKTVFWGMMFSTWGALIAAIVKSIE